MNSATRSPGNILLVNTGYKYIFQKFLGFIATEGGVSTEPGVPYLSRYPHNYSNFSISPVVHTCFIGGYFSSRNTIDNRNMMHQSDLLFYTCG